MSTIFADTAVRRPPDVRVSKILAGQEAEKTNLMLQALAEAINANVDNKEIVRKTLKTLGDSNGNENEEPAVDRKEAERAERRRAKEERANASREREREEPAPEPRSRSKDHSRVSRALR